MATMKVKIPRKSLRSGATTGGCSSPVVTPLRNMDFLGIFTFMVAIVPILLGLTNKGETNSQGVLNVWTDPSVGGLLLLGLVILALFVFVEARAIEPIFRSTCSRAAPSRPRTSASSLSRSACSPRSSFCRVGSRR